MGAIPTVRVLQKLDEYLAQKDYDGAEQHLEYWLQDARASRDKRGELTVANEQIGFYRKTGREAQAIAAAEYALGLAQELGLQDSITTGTTLVNAATAYKAFNRAEKALPLYERAKEIYEAHLNPDDSRLGGLYNNMALALMDMSRWESAEELFNKALDVMSKVPGGEAEMAITWCNLADLYTAKGEERTKECLQNAFELLGSENITRDGYYAFVCEKCAPTFAGYGYSFCEKELLKRARKIYEGS